MTGALVGREVVLESHCNDQVAHHRHGLELGGWLLACTRIGWMLLHAWLVHLRSCERVHLSALGSTEIVLEVLVNAAPTDEKLLMRQVE